jgi:LysM repeat protein
MNNRLSPRSLLIIASGVLAAVGLVAVMSFMSVTAIFQPQATPTETAQPVTPTTPPTATILPTATIASSPTITPTLLPPPTFEPPTDTPMPSDTPTITPTATFLIQVDIPGLRGAETATPSSTPGCEPRDDWQLIYEVKANDALARIADQYGVYTNDLAAANCLNDPDVIVVGQKLRVPGDAHPAEVIYDCSWELLTPIDNTFAVEGEGTLTFNWRGPRAPRNLIRIVKPDGSLYERVIELRQNETIDLEDIPEGGNYTWYVYPLDWNFVQIGCHEGGPWRFTKDDMPPPTETPSSGGFN